MDGEFDLESVRHRVKLLRDTGSERLFENRGGVDCPVCGRPFDEGLATTARTCELSPGESVDVCLLRGDGRVFVFTHA
jgi:hypothetical protein